MDGLTDAPAVPANDLSGVGSVEEQLDTARRREKAAEEESQPIGDLGSRFARGATEVAASLPEAAAIAGAGNPNASALFAQEEVDRAREQIALAEQRLSENPDMSEEGRKRIQDVIAAERRKVAAYEPLIATAEGPLKPAAQDRPLFQRGDKLRAVSEELFGTPDPQFDDRFISKLAEGGGSMAGFVGATILTGLPGIVATGSAVNSSGMYRRAIQEGASEEQARTAAYLGAIVGTTEAVPIGRALNLLPAKARGRVANALGRRLSDAFRSAGEEGAQEAMTEISNNLIARGIWNPDQNAFDGAGEAALIGAILGGGLGAVASTPRDDQRLDSPRLTEADRASPLPNAVIDDGKAAIEDLLSGKAPVQPAPQQVPTNPPSNLPRNAAPAGGETPQAPAQPVQEQAPVAAGAIPEPEAMTLAPAQPEGGDAEVLPVMDENGRETGEFVRLNPTTGQIEKIIPEAPVEVDTTPAPTPQAEASKEETIADEPSAPRQEAEQPQGQTGPDVTPVDIPQTAGPVEVVERRARGNTTLQKRPVANELKTRGLTVKPGSPLAEELKARGINARTHPGLFNSNGVSDWDNLPADEWGDYRYEVGEDGNGYLNRQGVIDALESEMRGAPVQVGEQADLQMAADAKEAQARFEAADPDPEEIDLGGVEDAAVVITHPEEDISTPSERMEYVARSVDAAMVEIGMSGRVAAGRRQEIIGILNDRGGNVEDAVWWNLHREADGYAEQTSKTRLAEQPADGQTARSSDAAPQVQGDPGRSQGQPGAKGQRQGIDQDDRRSDVGQAQEPAATAVSDADAEAGRVAPAPLPSIPDDLPKPKSKDLPETRGQGQRFHGSPAPIERLDEGVYTSQNYYGQGFYTSDAIDIVDGYARRKKQAGNVYRIEEVAPVNAFDMEQPVPDFVVNAFRDLPEYSTIKEILEVGLMDDAGAVDAGSVREMYDRIREEADYSADTIQEAFDTLRETFFENGFNALDHTGGLRTKKKPHQVRIYLEPEKQIRFTEIDRNAPTNPTTERTEAGEQAVIPGAEQSAERSAKARKADERREMEARQKQSKARTAVPQDDAGPLFDTQGDMFDAPKGEVSEPKAKPEAPKAKPSKTQERLNAILRDEWTAREDLPEDANDDFIAATKRVQEARRALADEFGEETAKAAMEDIEAGYKPKPAEPVQERTDQEPVKKERIDDFGQKIGAPAATWVASARRQDAMELPDSLSAEADSEVAHDVDEGNVRTYQAAAVARGHAPARREAYTFAEAKEAVKEFRGLPLVNRDSGIEAVVSSNSLGKMLSMSAVAKSETPAVHSLAVANIDSLFENAIYGWMKPDERGQHGVAGMHRLFARMDKPDGSASMVKLTVKETERVNQQNKLYTVEAVEFLDDGASAETWVMSAFRSDGNGPKIDPSAEAILDIARDVEKFNSLEGKELRADPTKLKELMPALRERLDKLMIRGVDLSIDPDMDEQGAVEFGPEGIQILIGNTLGGMNTVNHEAIHVLRARGLFTDAEWSALAAEAENRWMAEHDIEARYPDLSKQAQIEEAIAEAFAAHVDGQSAQGRLKSAFAKISRFFRAMKEALTGQGIRTPEDIFEAVERGEVGSRDLRVDVDQLIGIKNQRQAPQRKTNPLQSMFDQEVPTFIPDRKVWEEFNRSGKSIWGRVSGAASAMHDKVDRARVQVQDRFLPVLRAQEAIERATGRAVPEQMNAYLAEETFSGKVGRHLFEIDEEFTKPIIDLISETNGEMTVDTVGKWLTARHAKERNHYIASINDKMPDGGSGMTNAEAESVLRDVASGKYAESYQKIGKMLDDLRDRTMDLRVDAGLMTKRDAMLLRSQYKHYVPLKGFEKADNYEAYLNLHGVNARYTVKGQETQRALGRSSEAFNPLQAAITQAQEVAVRAEKNRVGRSLFDLASHNPSEALWEVKDVITKRYYNKTTGRVEEMAVDPATMRLEPNELAVKINGKEKRIIFHDPRLAAAAGTVGADQMGAIIRILSMASRYFSAVNTMLDPEFVIRNAFRDMTTAQINIRNFGKDDRNRIAYAMVKNWRKAFVAVYRGQSNKADTEWTRYYREFEQAGGKVSFWKLDQPEAGKSDLERRVNLATGNKFIRVGKVITSPKAFFSERDNAALSAVERVNLSVDNAIRLAAFVEARKAGWSKAQAASLSKNLTVNFNRRGLKGPGLNAAYPFFNAAMQGSQILVRAMTSKRMAKYMVALVGYGVFEDMVNAAISEEDDDGELAYDKIPDWKLEMNLVWMRSDGNATTVPLPYGYNVFPYLGKQIGKVMRGVKDPGEAFGDVASATFGAFSPVAMDQSENTGLNMVKLLSPMATDTLIEMASNRDWLDRPIRPENPYGDYGPDAYKFYGGAAESSKTIADFLNRISGGNMSEAGAIDISPEYIDHMTAFLTGGAGRFAGRASDITIKLLSGDLDLIEGHKIPFARSINTTTGTWLDKDRYYRFRDEVREAVAAVQTEVDTGDPVFSDTRVKASLSSEVKIADRRLKKIRKERDAAGDNASPAQRLDWERREAMAVLSFNRKYIEKLGAQAE